jgi:Ca-activated chloride channel homolog
MMSGNTQDAVQGRAGVSLVMTAERRLVRPENSARHIDLAVTAPRSRASNQRDPLALALVIDRSGSMQGSKLKTAKEAALSVLNRLSERDTASVTVFDSEVETILPEGEMTGDRKTRARSLIAGVEARSNTALHEGWLTGCRSIAAESAGTGTAGRLSRCFLLTDGLANQGLTDPEEIAAQAADVRRKTGISTSTFGIGDDYSEGLLAPLAVAGNGQFHHLRDEADISATFSGELGEMFDVAARAVRIEIEADQAVTPELISMYWGAAGGGPGTLRIDLGDLISEEERHVVVRLNFSRVPAGALVPVRARAVWRDGNQEAAGPWQELRFAGADNAACSAEGKNMAVMHWVGLHHAEKTRTQALALFRVGDVEGAARALEAVMRRIREYASPDPDLERLLVDLEQLRRTFKEKRMTQGLAKEVQYRSNLGSRMQRDLRRPSSES